MRTRFLPGFLTGLALAPLAAAQAPVFSPEFQVNTTTTTDQYGPAVANTGPDGNFVIVWTGSNGQDGDLGGIFGRRFDVTGAPLGGEFPVNAYTTSDQGIARIGSNDAGNFVVTWTHVDPGAAGYEIRARRFDATGTPQGGDIAVNTYTTGVQARSSVGVSSTGSFVVVWDSAGGQDGDDLGVFAQRFDSAGAKVGNEFQVNQYTTGYQARSRIAMKPAGDFIVVWASPQDAQLGAIMARRYDAAGNPLGGEFQVNTTELGAQYQPDVALAQDGKAIIVWTSYAQDGSSGGIFAQRLDSAGARLGPEFNVNTYTTGLQSRPRVAAGPNGGDGHFAIIWQSLGPDGDGFGVRAQHFDSTGKRLGVELPVNNFTADFQGTPALAPQPNGQFVAAWESFGNDGSGYGVAARLAGFPGVELIQVDTLHAGVTESPGGGSNLNGVFESGETVAVEPFFRNFYLTPFPMTGTASNLRGLAGPVYTINDPTADYGMVISPSDCFTATGDCYQMSVSGTRPAQHWDAAFDETLSYNGFSRVAALHIGGSFADVPQNAFYPFIENLFHNGVTGGCATGYCPGNNVTRAQMAVFLLKARYGSGFIPAPATGTAFPDVPASNLFAPWIEELSREGITGGCGGGLYCPNNPVTRQQMAVFLLKTLLGATYVPDACAGDFNDVPCPSQFADWIEDLAGRSITGGCQVSPPLYCPTNSVLRQQMAAFLVKTFGLQLYGE